MNAYLFAAITTRSQLRPNPGRSGPAETFQTWDDISSLIILAENAAAAQERFEDILQYQPEDQPPLQTKVRKIAAAQLAEHLITESGEAPLDWDEIYKQIGSQVQSEPVDDFEQGYWLDVEIAVPRKPLAPDVEGLQQILSAEDRTGLNWSADKQFYYLLTALSLSQAPTTVPEEPDLQPKTPDSEEADAGLPGPLEVYPQAADKEAVALIQARNSAVAAWLWRRFVAGAPIAANPIRIDPWCPVVGGEAEES